MRKGDILGHEFMGEVIEVGEALEETGELHRGDRVVVPFAIACGRCTPCVRGLWALCDNSNPNAALAEAVYGFAGAGLFGYSHLYGGYAGGHAQYVRVPFGDTGPMRVPVQLTDEQAIFLSDILPTAYMAAENCEIQPGDTIAVWGCGPVGLLSIVCAQHLGAGKVIAMDRFPDRLYKAAGRGALTLNYEDEGDVVEALKQLTGGRGPDACIDAVGMEAHAPGPVGAVDKAKQTMKLQADRPHALRQAIQACRKGGVVSIPGVYSGWVDKMPMGVAFAKGLRLRMGQTHVHRYMKGLLEKIVAGELDPTFIITHQVDLDGVPDAFRQFCDKEDGWIKVIVKPQGTDGRKLA
jgi:threonine dehydrogenase-like Zn-dependent dehydrogenase